MNLIDRRQTRVILGGLIAAAWASVSSAAPLPDDLKLVVSVSGEGTQTLHLHKRTARTADFVLYTWDASNGYVAQPTPEVRTFKGSIGENPNALVFASINADNRLKAYCIDMEWGHGRRWTVSNYDVSSQLGSPLTPDPMPSQPVAAPVNGSAGIPNVGPKVPTGTSGGGIPYGDFVEAELGLDCPIAAYTRYGSNLDNVLASYETDLLLWELMMARDLLVRVVVPTAVIRTDNFYTSDPGNTPLGELKTAWLAEPLVSRGWDNVWASEGYYASGNGVGQDEYSFAAGALFHEIAHNWTAYHLAYMADTMGGNRPSIGPRTADTMLNKRKEAIDENKLPAGTFVDPLPPHTYVDVARTQVNTAIDIDVMANDHDANGDSLSIVNFTATTVPGGTVTLNGNGTLHYVPPTGHVGKDIIVYTVQDDSPMGLKTRDVVHIEVVNNGLMVHYDMEDATGTLASDLSGVGVAGDLNGADFATDSVPSPLGKGVRADGTQDENQTENGEWSGILMGSGNVMPVALGASRETSPLEQEYNQHSAYYDIMDGDYTFATWFRADSFNNNDYPQSNGYGPYIAARRWHPETKVGWDLYAQGNTVGMHWHIFDGTKTIEHLSAGYPLTEGKWYHIAAVFDRAADEIRILVNGQVVATRANAFAGTNGYIFNGRAPLAVGEFSNNKMCFDDVRIYSKALSTADVQGLYALPGSGVARFLGDSLQYTAYSDHIFEQSLWANMWTGGAEPLTFEILNGPAWLTIDSEGVFSGIPSPADAGLNTFTVKMTDNNSNVDTMTLEINVPVVPTASRVAHWKLDEGSGSTTADDTGNGYNGTLTGASWTAGKNGGALSFNGTSDQVTCGAVPASSKMTFAGWIKPTDTSSSQALFGKSSSYTVKMSGSNLVFTRPGVADYGSSGVGLTAGVWQHVAVTIDGGSTDGLKFYKDGVLVSRRTASAPSANSNPVLLANNQWNERFDGLLDDMQIFNAVLTPDEVGALYEGYTSGVGLFARWSFDEGSGLTALDATGNGYDGVLDAGIGWVAGHGGGSAVAMTTSTKIDLGGKAGPLRDWTLATWVQRKGNTSSAILFDSDSSVIKLEQWANTHRVGITQRGNADWSFNYTTPLNQWVHLTLVGGHGEVNLYVNGALQDTLAQSIGLPFTSIGHSSEGLNAWLDDTLIYNRALNAADVLKVYRGDADLDGMRDTWEEQYFPDGTATRPYENADMDIHSNLDEYVAGMDPTNAASYFRIMNIRLEPAQGFALEWESFADRLYSVYWAQNLTNDFIHLDDISGPQNSYTDAVYYAENTGFYFLEVNIAE